MGHTSLFRIIAALALVLLWPDPTFAKSSHGLSVFGEDVPFRERTGSCQELGNGSEIPVGKNTYKIYCNAAFTGTALDLVAINSFELCILECNNNAQCIALRYSNSSAVCMLYSAVSSIAYSNDLDAAINVNNDIGPPEIPCFCWVTELCDCIVTEYYDVTSTLPAATTTPAITTTPLITTTSTTTTTTTTTTSTTPAVVPGTITFGFTGGEQYWRVPAGVTLISAQVRGCPGQRESSWGGEVGAGGLATGQIIVTPGEQLTITCGGWNGFGGGAKGGKPYNLGGGLGGGAGGGLSAIWRGAPYNPSTALMLAGGGAGEARETHGGAGGGTEGASSINAAGGGQNGGGSGRQWSGNVGADGPAFNANGGGGGGGGWYGGAGGQSPRNAHVGGGGGGSGYLRGGAVINGVLTTGGAGRGSQGSVVLNWG